LKPIKAGDNCNEKEKFKTTFKERPTKFISKEAKEKYEKEEKEYKEK